MSVVTKRLERAFMSNQSNSYGCGNYEINWKRLSPLAAIPKLASSGAAGLDLTAIKVWPLADNLYRYETGIAFEIPKGMVGLLFPRSSVYKTGMILANCVGVIDSDYRGDVSFVYRCTGLDNKPYEVGDRIGQIVFMFVPQFTLSECDELSDTDRGSGGYGSTGK